MADHVRAIKSNLVFLCDNTNCTNRLLDNANETGIITRDESVEIERQPKGYDRNRRLYQVLQRKDAVNFSKLVGIMEDKDTKQSNEVLSCLKTGISKDNNKQKSLPILNSKWWPEEKTLVNSVYERKKDNDILLVEEINNVLTKEHKQIAVISQKVAISGFGGVGKTTLAKWYAHHYSDKYDHIIWIDCGEGSVMKSFLELSTDLKVERENEYDLRKLAKECFLKLKDKVCLCIFDNAERYVGRDGIKDILPKSERFNSIITSRCREWGNDTGLGKISQLQLDVFTMDESLEFLVTNLKSKSYRECDMKALCDVLGNLPLGLQIAVAMLNKQKIGLPDYIQIFKNTDQIIDKNFDDYERTINAALLTSVDYIKREDNRLNQLAYRILLTMAYIQPDDVSLEFLQAVEHCESWEIQVAMDLLETYSLVSIKTTWCDDEMVTYEYSIHRLLQHVVRYNGRKTENDTLKKIFNCEGFLNIKLLPFKLAESFLKSHFPKLRAELVDQPQLLKLTESHKFDNAQQLSSLI